MGGLTNLSGVFYNTICSSLLIVGVGTPLPYCAVPLAWSRKAYYTIVRFSVWSPSNLLRVTLASRGNSASGNLQRETQWPKCCLYKTPYVAAPIRETGDIIVRTLPYEQLPTYAPTRTRIFVWFKSNGFLKGPILLKYWLLHPFSMRKPHAQAVPRKDYFMHLRTLKNAIKGC